jgi:hypothetical protein
MQANRNRLFANGDWLLAHTNELEPRLDLAWAPVLRLWEDVANPSGEIRTTNWTIFRFTWPDEEVKPWLREVVWDRYSDIARLIDPREETEFDDTPSLNLRDCLLTRSSVAAIEEWAARLTVPVSCSSEAVSSHATRYGIEIKFFSGSTRLEWTDDIPVEWLEIVQKAQQLRNYFRKSLDYCNSEVARMNV